MTFTRYFAVAALVLASVAPPAAAQELTTEQMIDLFRAQKKTIEQGTVRAFIPKFATGEEPELVLQPAGQPVPESVAIAVAPPDQLALRIQFAFNSAVLDGTAEASLRKVCAAVVGANVGTLRIAGHSDASGEAAYNETLSSERANAVRQFFVADCHIDLGRLQAVGYGESQPLDTADPYAAINRRVEFQVAG